MASWTWDIFCTVVDNYGDIGVSWRLARQLAAEQGATVRLWVDDLASFRRLEPLVDPGRAIQTIGGVTVCRWAEPFPITSPGDVVVEMFACKVPEDFLRAMADRPRPPVWVNLEYLSAEDWVGDCHGLASPHPRLPLVKHFFFPGFTPGTGGLLRETHLLERRRAFQDDAEETRVFWATLGMPPPGEDELRFSLFGYRNDALPGLLAAWEASGETLTALIPEGALLEQAGALLGTPLKPGQSVRRGNLTLRGLPFSDQDGYDRLLWACDVNFVRGEDSFVRAQWAARPFVWQIYPQAEGAHHLKLDAFLARYREGLPTGADAAQTALWHAWNGRGDARSAWPLFRGHLADLRTHDMSWAEGLTRLGDLAANLARFCQSTVK